MIRLLRKEEMKEIYETYMVRDFPGNELKPLDMLEEPFYTCLGYFEEEKLIGYAVLVACQENRCLLLDYFAVLSEYRKQGKGTQFLSKLKERYKEWRAILIETEEKQSEEAIKRIQFYKQQASAEITSLIVNLYYVDYRILMIPLSVRLEDEEVKKRIIEIYNRIYDPVLLKRYLKFKQDLC